jgi:hypothetical protein
VKWGQAVDECEGCDRASMSYKYEENRGRGPWNMVRYRNGKEGRDNEEECDQRPFSSRF